MRGSDTGRTQFTGGQMALHRLLHKMGFSPELEVPFGNYCVDIYLRSCHVAIEFDGPGHNKKHDQRRDKELYDKCELPVYRVEKVDGNTRYGIMEFISKHSFSSSSRKARLWE